VAPLPAGEGHIRPGLRRFVLLQHHQGQVTAERITGARLGIFYSVACIVRPECLMPTPGRRRPLAPGVGVAGS
jgi:creatinine amidohydrolase/Fe(II)-dependent formamide hydrolase-like protein